MIKFKLPQIVFLLIVFLGSQVFAASDPKRKLMTHKASKNYHKPRFKATWLQDNGKQKPSKKRFKQNKKKNTASFYNSKRIR